MVIALNLNIISVTARTISFEIINESCFFTLEEVNVYLNKNLISTINTNVYTIRNLEPNTMYQIFIEDKTTKEKSKKVEVKTDCEAAILNVKQFGAKGDGKTIDTQAIQAAIAACPKGGMVLIPQGVYPITSIFLKSDITLYLERDSILLGTNERIKYPILPGIIKSYNETKKYYLGSWEGEPLDSFASLINGVNIKNVNIIGEGKIEGNSDYNTWWLNPKVKKIAWRPRTIFFNGCRNITIEGLAIQNSPSWTIHPLMSKNLKFINMNIINPKDSPNTDGIDPESCENVLILGVRFSVGDDCIAIKSGKLNLEVDNIAASKGIYIRNCHMEHGHGGVVIGSEMSGGIKDIYVEKCLFENTDRGIRIKTRRGRGKNGIIDNIYANNIKMQNVLTPFVINCFYNCDYDGHTEYVWSKGKLPIDERTPYIRNIYLKNIKCTDAQIAASFVYGLPESKIEKICMEDIYVHLSTNAKPGYPAMMDFIHPISRYGFYFNNVKYLKLNNVKVKNALTEPIMSENVVKSEIC